VKRASFKVLYLIPALTALFFFDDLLLVILVKELAVIELSSWQYALVLIVLFAFSVILAFAVHKVMRRAPSTGSEGLVGGEGTIVGRREDLWLVALRGEIWNAEGTGRLRLGDRVVVRSMDGLTLTVSKI